jgi:hypothetical protein
MSIERPQEAARGDLLNRAYWHAMQAKQNRDRADKYPQHRKRWMRAFLTRNAEAHQRAAENLIRRANAARDSDV